MARHFGRVRWIAQAKVWEIDVRPHGRIREVCFDGVRPVRLRTRELAEDVLSYIRADIRSGKTEEAAVAPYLPRAMSTVDKVVARWMDEMRERIDAGEISPRTLKQPEAYATPNGLFSWLYQFSVYEVTAGHLSDWNLWMMKQPRQTRGNRPGTVSSVHQNTRRHAIAAMRTIFRWLHARGELESIPRFPSVAKKKHVPNTIVVDDQEKILAAIPEDRRGPLMIAVEEVFRPGEVRALNVSDYNFKTGIVTMAHAMDGDTNTAERKRTKEEDVRVREVSERLFDWLDRHVPPEERVKGDRPLFVNPDARNEAGRYNAQALRLTWRRAAKSIGLAGVGMYEGTKHSTLTEARRRGAPLDHLRVAAGHRDARSTEIYAELAQDQAARVLRLVPRGGDTPSATRRR